MPETQGIQRIMATRLPKILAAQYAICMEKSPFENLLAVMDPSDMMTWYFLVAGLPAPYEFGEYIFRLKVPDEFPIKPPSFSFVTPNGLYVPYWDPKATSGGKICISVGEYHANDTADKGHGGYGWRPALGMQGFAVQVVNGLVCYKDGMDHGINIKALEEQSDTEKAALAKSSRKHNETNCATIYALFEDIIRAKPDLLPVRVLVNARRKQAGLQPLPAIKPSTGPAEKQATSAEKQATPAEKQATPTANKPTVAEKQATVPAEKQATPTANKPTVAEKQATPAVPAGKQAAAPQTKQTAPAKPTSAKVTLPAPPTASSSKTAEFTADDLLDDLLG